MTKPKVLRVAAISNGTVIDHIPKHRGLKVLRLLEVEDHDSVISIGINVSSSKIDRKDIIKIENRLLTKEEFDRIALIAPTATVNLIKGWKVVEKSNATIPQEMVGLLACFNPSCVTNNENMKTHFHLEQENPLKIRCHYCERIMTEQDVLEKI